jgi:Predicted membrane protein
LAIDREKLKPLMKEFGRYLIVGGTAFIIDYAAFYLTSAYVFNTLELGVYFATAFGFILGLIYNYIMSLVFVFRSAKEQNRGKTVGAFLVFAVIGVIGLLLSEGGMYLVYDLLDVNEYIARVLVAGAVTVWNYAARKLLIFREEKKHD